MKYQSLKGMQDFSQETTAVWQQVEKICKEISENYGFSEVRFPLLEKTDLFIRTTGEGTDIVEKEIYSFLDKEDNSISLRPEGTAGCVRALVENGWDRVSNPRYYYMGTMFRYERPQKGRYRQFNQFGIESFCNANTDSDIEILMLSAEIFKRTNLFNKVLLNINYLGKQETKENFKKALVEYLLPYQNELDEDSQKRLVRNPLRILDTKDENTKNILLKAPKLKDYWSLDEKENYEKIVNALKVLGIPFMENENLVRGLDYYTGLVFEWVTGEEKAQNAVCSGGRYDNLVEELGGNCVPGVGFGIGLERLVNLFVEDNPPLEKKKCDFYIIWNGDKAFLKAIQILNTIRNEFPDKKCVLNKGISSFKNQFKRASDFQSRYSIIIGENEVEKNEVSVKDMDRKNQALFKDENFIETLKNWIIIE